MVVRRCAIVFSLFAIFTVLSGRRYRPGSAAFASRRATRTGRSAGGARRPLRRCNRPTSIRLHSSRRPTKRPGSTSTPRIKSWREELDRVEQGMRDPKAEFKALNDFRTELFKVRTDAEEFWKKLEPVLHSANEEVQALPAAPAQGQAAEPEQAALYRAETTAYYGYLTSARGALDSTNARIGKLLGHLLDVRRSRVTSNLFQRSPGAFFPETWESAPGQILELVAKVRGAVMNWWHAQEEDQILPLAAVALAMWVGLSVFSLVGVRRLRRWKEDGEPPFWRRASDAAGIILLRSLPVVLPLVFLYNAIEGVQAFPNDIGWLFYAGARSIIIVVVVNALISTALSPSDHRWRLIPASNAAAVRLSGLMLTVALVYGAGTLFQIAALLFKAPDSPKLALTMAPNTVIALLVIAILQTRLREDRVEGVPSASWLRFLRLPAWLIAIAIVASGAAGYLYLSRFIAQQLIVTGAILAIVYLLLLWADGVAQAMGSENSGMARWLAANAKLDQSGRQRLSVPVSLLLKFAVLLSAIPLILNQWQFAWADIFEWYRQLFFGFQIGSTQVSLAAFFAAIVVFTLGYFAAKFFQQWLDTQVLKPAAGRGACAIRYVPASATSVSPRSIGEPGTQMTMRTFHYAGVAEINVTLNSFPGLSRSWMRLIRAKHADNDGIS